MLDELTYNQIYNPKDQKKHYKDYFDKTDACVNNRAHHLELIIVKSPEESSKMLQDLCKNVDNTPTHELKKLLSYKDFITKENPNYKGKDQSAENYKKVADNFIAILEKNISNKDS